MGSRGPLIKSMFVRRVVLLGAVFVGGISVLLAQSWRLTVAKSDKFLQIAERRTIQEVWTPSVRGRILDRKGRILAEDAPAFDVLANYDLITGDRAEAGAARQARREHKDEWPKLDRTDREKLIATYLPEWDRQQEMMWDALAEALGEPRSVIDDRCREIEEDVEHLAHTIWKRREDARAREMARQRELTTEVGSERDGPDLRTPIAEQKSAHVIASGIDEATAFRVRRVVEMYPGLTLDSAGARTYPMESVMVDIDPVTLPPPVRDDPTTPKEIMVGGLATHIIGWMRQAYREDMDLRPRVSSATGLVDRGYYMIGDRAGSTGIEGSHERELRGLRGSVTRHRDTGESAAVEPVPGSDVHLTIDAALQARIQAAMAPELGIARTQLWHRSSSPTQTPPMGGELGVPIYGAAVVLDIDTGEILSMVSTPSFTRADLAADPNSIYQDPIRAPWVNRAIGKPYQPGSPIKPLILCAACTQGVHSISHQIECTGHLIPNDNTIFRCWVYKQFQRTHGIVDAPTALSVSCNIYFYTLGRALGPAHLPDWLARFGIGRPMNLGLGGEFAGTPGTHADGSPLTNSESILIGIGQGPVAWTPTIAADVYATIARGGMRLVPHIVKDQPVVHDDLHLDPGALDAIYDGLRRGVEDDDGTSSHINFPMADGTVVTQDIITVPGVSVIAKTGTAAASPIIGPGIDGAKTVLRSGDHGWMVALVGAEGAAPRYAVAVIMEYAGSGSRSAGPIMDQVIWALRAEGYL